METIYIVIAQGVAIYASMEESAADKVAQDKIRDLEMGGTIWPKVKVTPLPISK